MNRPETTRDSPRDLEEGRPRPLPRMPILETAAILSRWRRVIIGFTAGVLVVTAAYSMLAPAKYSARSSILPKQEENQIGGLTQFINSQFGGVPGILSGETSSSDVLMSIIESRFLRDRIIERLDLIGVLKIKAKTPERARDLASEWLESHVESGLTRRLSIFVEASAPTPKLAADIANGYFAELDRLNKEFAFTSARQTRIFIEQRLQETRDSLSSAQTALEIFQEGHGMVALDEQAKAAVEVAARLQGELITLEAQHEVQSQYYTGSFSKNRDIQYRINAIKNRLSELGTGRTPLAPGEKGDLMIPFSSLPSLGHRLADLMLDVKTYEAVYMLLITQYQQAKIDEARDVPTIQLLDVAVPPTTRSSPRRKINMMVGLGAGLGIGIFLAFGLESLHRSLRGPTGPRIREVFGPRATRIEAWMARVRES